MTRPNRHLKNQIVLISRRTLSNEALILPSHDGSLAREISYIIAFNANRFELKILSLQFNPRGYEMVIFDPHARRSEFSKATNQLISLRVKRRIEHDESLWTTAKPGNQPILDLPTLQREIVHGCTFAVRKGFVKCQSDWEMPQIGPADWGKELSFRNSRGDEVLLSAGPGDLLAKLVDVEILKKTLCSQIKTIEKEQASCWKEVLGMEACYCKATFEKWKFRVQKRVKRYLCESVERIKAAKERMRTFCKQHRKALVEYIEGKETDAGRANYELIEFPAGTLKMRTHFGQICSSAEADDPHRFRL